jgi:hypothetical protein
MRSIMPYRSVWPLPEDRCTVAIMTTKPSASVEQIRDYIDGNIMPLAANQWEELKAKDPEDPMIKWVEGRIDASLQILQTIDRDLFDKWTDSRDAQRAKFSK